MQFALVLVLVLQVVFSSCICLSSKPETFDFQILREGMLLKRWRAQSLVPFPPAGKYKQASNFGILSSKEGVPPHSLCGNLKPVISAS
jgi:hypothetical protein